MDNWFINYAYAILAETEELQQQLTDDTPGQAIILNEF